MKKSNFAIYLLALIYTSVSHINLSLEHLFALCVKYSKCSILLFIQLSYVLQQSLFFAYTFLV